MLLAETNRPINQIAVEAGFSNLSNFNRRFLAARHVTPRAFRRFVMKHGRMPEAHAPQTSTSGLPRWKPAEPRYGVAVSPPSKDRVRIT